MSAIWNVYSASLWCSLPVRTTLQSGPKYLVWFMLRLTELHRTKLWCWVVIKAVGRMRFLFRHNRSVWCWILITMQFKPEELSDLYSAANMSLCADANITGTFLPVHYKLHQGRLQKISTMVAFCPVVFCPYTERWKSVKSTLHNIGLIGMIHEEIHLCISCSCKSSFETIQTWTVDDLRIKRIPSVTDSFCVMYFLRSNWQRYLANLSQLLTLTNLNNESNVRIDIPI